MTQHLERSSGNPPLQTAATDNLHRPDLRDSSVSSPNPHSALDAGRATEACGGIPPRIEDRTLHQSSINSIYAPAALGPLSSVHPPSELSEVSTASSVGPRSPAAASEHELSTETSLKQALAAAGGSTGGQRIVQHLPPLHLMQPSSESPWRSRRRTASSVWSPRAATTIAAARISFGYAPPAAGDAPRSRVRRILARTLTPSVLPCILVGAFIFTPNISSRIFSVYACDRFGDVDGSRSEDGYSGTHKYYLSAE